MSVQVEGYVAALDGLACCDSIRRACEKLAAEGAREQATEIAQGFAAVERSLGAAGKGVQKRIEAQNQGLEAYKRQRSAMEAAARREAKAQREELERLGRIAAPSSAPSSAEAGMGLAWGEEPGSRGAEEVEAVAQSLGELTPTVGAGQPVSESVRLLLDANELLLTLEAARVWAPEEELEGWIEVLRQVRQGGNEEALRRRLDGVREAWQRLRKEVGDGYEELAQEKAEALALRQTLQTLGEVVPADAASRVLKKERTACRGYFRRGDYKSYIACIKELVENLQAAGVAGDGKTTGRLLEDAGAIFRELGYEDVEVRREAEGAGASGVVIAFSRNDDHNGEREITFSVEPGLRFHFEIGRKHDSQAACTGEAERFYEALEKRGWSLALGAAERTLAPSGEVGETADDLPSVTLDAVAAVCREHGLDVERSVTEAGGLLVIRTGSGDAVRIRQEEGGLVDGDGETIEDVKAVVDRLLERGGGIGGRGAEREG